MDRFGDMPYEFQRVMDSVIGTIPFTTCYIDDIRTVIKGSHKEQTDIVNQVLSTLDNQNIVTREFLHWEKKLS